MLKQLLTLGYHAEHIFYKIESDEKGIPHVTELLYAYCNHTIIIATHSMGWRVYRFVVRLSLEIEQQNRVSGAIWAKATTLDTRLYSQF